MTAAARTAALQPISFETLTRVTNNASCNWVNLVRVGSVPFSSSAVNTAHETDVQQMSVCVCLLCLLHSYAQHKMRPTVTRVPWLGQGRHLGGGVYGPPPE